MITTLADKLRSFHASAPDRKKMLSVHLFGIKHAAELSGIDANDLAERAGLKPSLGTELRKGARLAEYVSLTKDPF